MKGVLRAPAEGEGGVARREDLTATAAATLERSAGTVAQGTMAARERRRRSAKVSRGRRAVGGACACSAILTAWVPGRPRQEAPALYLELASQNLGKYTYTVCTIKCSSTACETFGLHERNAPPRT